MLSQGRVKDATQSTCCKAFSAVGDRGEAEYCIIDKVNCELKIKTVQVLHAKAELQSKSVLVHSRL